MTVFPIVVFHNPACGTSRNVVAMVRAAGYEPEVIEYLKAGWTIEQLQRLLDALEAPARHPAREGHAGRGTWAAQRWCW